MASAIYNNGKKYLLNGSIDCDTDTLKVMLCTSSYTPNIDTDDFRNDITNEVSSAGYTAGGATLGSPAVTADTTDDEAVFDAADSTWSGVTLTARYAVIYKARGGASSADELLCYIDFGSDKSASAGTFTIQWDAEGIINLN